jgi:hypothetical protein
MTCQYNTCFKSINNISENLLLNTLETNLKMFFDWSFLKIGAWFDVNIPEDNIYGGRKYYKLLPVQDRSYTNGQVWQGIKKDWVWEKNIVFEQNSPTSIDGVYINNNFLANSSNAFSVNYPLGRITFNTPVNTSFSVELNYSYRNVQVYRSTDTPWLKILQYNSFNSTNKDIEQVAEGEWSIGANHRVQLPCIIIESAARSNSRPYEMGNDLLWLEQDIMFYVLAENKNQRNKLLDIIRLQQDLNIQLFEANSVARNDAYPLKINGDLKSGTLKMYPDLVQQYPWRKCFFKVVDLFEMDSVHTNLYQGVARATLEIIST